MSISTIFQNILNFLKGLWSKLPDEKKEEIIKVILDGFKIILQAYYQSYKEKQNKNGAFSNAK
jgi:hypothetical protein